MTGINKKTNSSASSPRTPMLQIVGCFMGNLALNICATLFSPQAGVALAVGAIACWLFSAFPAEKWIKKHFKQTPVACVLLAVFLTGLACLTAVQGIKVYERKASVKSDTPCSTGDATANGTGNLVVSGCDNNFNSEKSK